MIDFKVPLPRTPRSLIDNKRFIIENNEEFLQGKSLLEFGVWNGNSLSMFSELYDQFNIEKKFYGFDSFLGLPEEKFDNNNPDYWYPGVFSTDPNIVKNKLPFTMIIDGWFQDTLNQNTLEEIRKNQIGIIHIDCDIYTSTIQILEWIVYNNLLVDGTLVIYDDWGGHRSKNVGEYECGEGKAHKEICEKYNLNFDFFTCDIINLEYDYEICTFKYNAN